MDSQTYDLINLPARKEYYRIGETIVMEGEPSDGWYVLLSGRVGVFKKDFSVAVISRPGTVIGELGFILDIPRTATLIAQEPTLLLHVHISVDELIANYPVVAKHMMKVIAERVVKTTEDWRDTVEHIPTL
jgi:CRP-like cAMP-binding protein